MNVVLVMFRDGERREFPLLSAKTVVGRREDCHLRIPTRDVSRQHCELRLYKNGLRVKDLGSSNGTFVNGKRIAEIVLNAGDQLRVGPVTFVVQINGQPAKIEPIKDAPSTTVTPASTPPPSDEETFDLTESDFDIDDAVSGTKDDDEEGMP